MDCTALRWTAVLTFLLLLCSPSEHVAALSPPRKGVSLRPLGESSNYENAGLIVEPVGMVGTSAPVEYATGVRDTPSNTQAQIDDIKVSVNLVQSAVRATHNELNDTKAQLAHLEAGFEFMKDELRQFRKMYQEEVETYRSQVNALISLVNMLDEKVQNNSQVTDSTRRESLLSNCSGTKVERGESGSLAVVVSGHYSANMDCGWRVELPAGVKILLRWVYFELESEESCKYDYVTLEDLTRPGHLLYGKKLCGSTRPASMVVDSHMLNITFHSDDSKNFRGFWLYYQAMPED